MESGGDRSSEQRAEAREARERARSAREQGLPDPEQPGRSSGGRARPDLGRISRYGGGMDAFMRRRLVAAAAVVVVLLLLFVMLGGC